MNYNKINDELIKNLNKGIKIINLSDYLRNYEKENPNEVIFGEKMVIILLKVMKSQQSLLRVN